MVNLVKILKKNSLRLIGKNYPGLPPQQLPVATTSIKDLTQHTGYKAFKLGRFHIKNAIVLHGGGKYYYAYVNPKYLGYRKFFISLVGIGKPDFDVDHVLSKNLAKKLNYNYVLLSIIPKGVNRRHGQFEREITLNIKPNVCFSDDRIFNKVLSRNPLARGKKVDLSSGFSSNKTPTYGLTLKQKGLWSSAFCLHQISSNCINTRLTII